MRMLSLTSLPFLLAGAAFGQYLGLTLPPSGNNQKAAVTQHIGPVQVTIEYSSPAVHDPTGKDRRGQIWGKLVPYGLADLGFGNGKPDPWRAGANENTVFAVSHDVMVEGKPLPAGRYGLHMIPGKDEWTIVFSKNSSAWGSFFYDQNEDALRVTVKPHPHDYREWLSYEFTVRRPSETTAELQWEELAVPWNIRVPEVNEIYVSQLSKELTGTSGFLPEGYDAAVQFCLKENIHLDQTLKWADAAITAPYIGRADFTTLSVKAQVLSKLGREDEAKTVMQTALHNPTATPLAIHQYGRQLLGAKKNAEALAVFQYNAERNGDVWPVHVGLARGYSATGDLPKALEHARKALPQAPDAPNRQILEAMIDNLSKGKPVDQ
jgi:tetratricopeptide (TPR) repeat protein